MGNGSANCNELPGYDFASYCAGEATHWGGGRGDALPGERAGSGIRRRHHDRLIDVYADSSGALVIPDAQLREVLAGAREIIAEDSASREQITRGEAS